MGEPHDLDHLLDHVHGSDVSRRDQVVDRAVARIEHVVRPHHTHLQELQQGRPSHGRSSWPRGQETLPGGDEPQADGEARDRAPRADRTLAPAASDEQRTAAALAASSSTHSPQGWPAVHPPSAVTGSAQSEGAGPALNKATALASGPAAGLKSRPPPGHRPPSAAQVVSGEGKELISSRYAKTQIIRRWGGKK